MRGIYIPSRGRRQVLCLLVDVALCVVAYVAASVVRFSPDIDDLMGTEALVPKGLVAAAITAVCLYYNDLYDDSLIRRRLELFVNLGRAFLLGGVVLSLVSYGFPALRVGRSVLTIYLPVAFSAVLAWRYAYLWAFGSETFSENIVILGTGQSARQIAEELIERVPLGYRIVGFLGEHRAEVGRRLLNPSVIGTIEDMESLVAHHRVNLIVVALDDRRGNLPIDSLLRCRLNGVRVEEVTNFYEMVTGQILVRNLRPSWLVFSQGFRTPGLVRNVKRVWELVASAVLVVLLAPLFALIALLIKLESRGPVFYRQERVGEQSRNFLLAKFRTMRVDAESASGPVWAAEGLDPRVTRVGRYLRKLRLDELPQLWNVLRGEMSFVGPRPERPHFVQMLRKVIPFYDQRLTVPPGITGWAQIKFSYGATIEDSEQKLQFDLYYIKHMSVLLDLAIILDTLKVMILGRGAR